jgi:hypothetical protein
VAPGTAANAGAGTAIVVQTAPPAPRPERRSRAPRGNYLWIDGHWEWRGNQYVWVNGHWERARAPEQWIWEAPRWEQQGQTWTFYPGRWVQRTAAVTVTRPGAGTAPPAPAAPTVVVTQHGAVGAPAAAAPLPPFQEYPDAHTAPAELGPGVALGQPSGFERGQRAGYWIWMDEGGEWHLRVTTAGRPRRFQGRVAPFGPGRVHLTGTTRTEWRDRVVQRPRAVVFDFTTQGGVDGIDFRPDGRPGRGRGHGHGRGRGHGCLKFHLKLDGEGDVKRVFLGARETPAPGSHFVVCP